MPRQPVVGSVPTPASAPEATPPKLSASELEKLVAPVALYPDPLLAVVLPASAYPVEIVMAARFVKDTNNLAKLDEQPWDPNVKAVARFPDVIQKMSDNLSWTSDLGQAFVAQQQDVMKAVQTMRSQAQASGALKSTPEQTVTTDTDVVAHNNGPNVVYVTNQVVQIQPAQPDVVYVPQYNPAVVYTAAPAYYYDSYVPFITFGLGVWFGSAFWGHCNWHYGCVGYPYYPYYPYHGYYGCGPHGYYPYHGWNNWSHATAPAGTAGAMSTAGAMTTSGGTAATAGSTRTSAVNPWRPDANRLRAAGTTGSQAAMQAQNTAAGAAPATRTAASPAISSASANRSTVAARPGAGTPSSFSSTATRGANTPGWSVNRTSSSGSAWSSRSVTMTTSQTGSRQVTVAGTQRPAMAGTPHNSPWTGQTMSRSSVSPGLSRPVGSAPALSSSVNYSRPASMTSSPWSGPAYSRPSYNPATANGGMRGSLRPAAAGNYGAGRSFYAPAAAPSFGGSRTMSAASAAGGGMKAVSGHIANLGKGGFPLGRH